MSDSFFHIFFGHLFGGEAPEVVVSWLCVLLGFVILFFLFISIYDIADLYHSTWVNSEGIIEQHHYQAEQHSAGIGYAANSNGGGAVITSSTTPEEYILFVRENGTGIIFKFDTNMQYYFSVKDGVKVRFSKRIGRISGSVIDKKII